MPTAISYDEEDDDHIVVNPVPQNAINNDAQLSSDEDEPDVPLEHWAIQNQGTVMDVPSISM